MGTAVAFAVGLVLVVAGGGAWLAAHVAPNHTPVWVTWACALMVLGGLVLIAIAQGGID